MELLQVHLYDYTTGQVHLYIVIEQPRLNNVLHRHLLYPVPDRRALCSIRDGGIHIHHPLLAVPVV